MTIAKEVFVLLNEIGLLDVILPFILVYSVVWSVLQRTKVLGEHSQQYNSVVAFVLGFFVVAALQIVDILQSIVQWSALAVIAIVFVAVFGKFFGGMKDPSKENYPKYIGLLVMGLIALYALGLADWISISFVENYLLPIILVIGFVVVIIWAIMRPESSDSVTTASPSKPDRKKKAEQVKVIEPEH